MAFSASFSGGTRLRTEEPRLRHAMVAQVFRLGVSERTKERSGRIVNTATDGVERSSNYRGTFICTHAGLADHADHGRCSRILLSTGYRPRS